MNFSHRSYRGKVLRPTPEIENDRDLGLFVIATAWGPKESATKVINTIKEYIVALRSDSDATSPFPRLACLSSNANNLRIATLLANEKIYREDNQNQYVTGVELFALSIVEKELSWVQVGHPNVFLKRKERGLLPIGCHVDLPMDLSQPGFLLPPLPNTVLGLDASTNPQVGSFIPQKGDQIMTISRSSIPKNFFHIADEKYNVEEMTRVLSEDDNEMAFWLGTLNL